MHRGHDHHHHHDGGGHGTSGVGAGHNHAPPPRRPVQWQTPHQPQATGTTTPQAEPDVDLVEKAFVEGFMSASDPTSFLRLAHVPFEATAADGARLVLLRVEVDAVADIGAVTPHLGGGSVRYDPLPAKMVSRRRHLRFDYFDGQSVRALMLAEVRGLAPAMPVHPSP